MTNTISLASLNQQEWDELLSAVGHHAEVLEEDAWDEDEAELRKTKALLGSLAAASRTGDKVRDLTNSEYEILQGALEHHEEVYSDAVLTESDPQPWLGIYQTTRSLRAKIGA